MKHSQRIAEDADELYKEATRVYRLMVVRAAVPDVKEETVTSQTS
jgi:hypothetical protein